MSAEGSQIKDWEELFGQATSFKRQQQGQQPPRPFGATPGASASPESSSVADDSQWVPAGTTGTDRENRTTIPTPPVFPTTPKAPQPAREAEQPPAKVSQEPAPNVVPTEENLTDKLFGPPPSEGPKHQPPRKRAPSKKKPRNESGRRMSPLVRSVVGASALVFCVGAYGAVEEVAQLKQRSAEDVAIAAITGFVSKPITAVTDIIDFFSPPDVEDLRRKIKEEPQAMPSGPTTTETPTIPTPSPKPSPRATAEATQTPTQTPSESTKPVDPRDPENGFIAGLSANYLAPITAEEVNQLETCHSVEEGILLTFNDTGSLETIKRIVSILDEKKVGAAFFPQNGSGAFADPEVENWLRDQGFYVGRYAKNKEDLVSTTVDPNDPVSVEKNINSIVEEITSSGTANLYRPPYDGMYTDADDGTVYFDPYIREAMKRAKVQGCLSTIQTHDLVTTTTAADIVETVSKNLKPDSVISAHMHDNGNIAKALPTIIDEARAKGYEFIENPGRPTLEDFTVMPIGSK
jgi:hypothetical protein